MSKDKVWIGADPGGRRNFGVAILYSGSPAWAMCVNCADEAIAEIKKKIKVRPAGVGVDAPLWWSSAKSSDRIADQWLRAKYGLSGGEVQTANSLRGAALVQGLMFVQRIRELFPNVGVTETHPKAVLRALKMTYRPLFVKRYSVASRTDLNEHECDAVVSAVAARQGFERRWMNDLSVTRGDAEQDPSTYWLAPVHYFWPED